MKGKVKMAVDMLMTAALLFLMGYQFWGETAHEWVGAGMFALFLAHHILNGGWHKNLFRGKYPPMRIFLAVIDVLTLLPMIAQMYSGIVLSRHVFAFLPIESGLALARHLHILDPYWGLPSAVKPEMGKPSALLILSPDVVNNPADKQQIH